MGRAFPLAAGVLAALAVAPAAPSRAADSVTEQIDAGRAYYEEGDYADAITELEFAIQEIRGRLAQLYAATLPAAPEGWTADEAATEAGAAMFGGGTVIGREYREEGGQGRIQVQLMVDNPMVQGMAAMFSNPALLAAQPNVERIRVGRDNAILKWEGDRGAGEVTLLLGGGRGLARLEGTGLADKRVLVDLLEAWDLRAVKDIAGL